MEKEVLQFLVKMAIGNALSAKMSISQLGQCATDARHHSPHRSFPLAKAEAKMVAKVVAKVVQLPALMGTGPVCDAEMSILP